MASKPDKVARAAGRASMRSATYRARTSLGTINETVLMKSAIAIDVRQKVLGAVGRAAHAVCHLDEPLAMSSGESWKAGRCDGRRVV